MSEPQGVAACEALPLCLNWRQTSPDSEADYVAETDTYEDTVGRIYRHDAGPQTGLWFWAMQADGHEISRNIGQLHGVERSARAAAHMVEAAWFNAIKGSSLDRPAPKRNAYAMAKGRV